MQSVAQTTTDTQAPYTPAAFWALYLGEHGHAERHADGSCWFFNDLGETTLLHDVDIPDLDMLGKLDLVHEQARLDALHGTLYALVHHRHSHHVAA